MTRLVLAAFALLLAGHGRVAFGDTTTVAEVRRLETTESPEPMSAVPRASGVRALSGRGALSMDETTTVILEHRLETTADPDTMTAGSEGLWLAVDDTSTDSEDW